MTAMTCKLNGLFNIGEDFDDEDLLGTDWTPCSASGPAKVAAAVASCALRASSVAHREPENIGLQRTEEKLAALRNGTASGSGVHGSTGQTVALGLRQLSSSSPPLPLPNNSQPNLAQQQSHVNTKGLMNSCVAQDEFDDWDVDLADLDECDSQMGQLQKPAASAPPAPTAEPPSSAKTLRPSAYRGSQSAPNQTLGGLGTLRTACNTSGTSGYNAALQSPPVAHRRSLNPRPASTTCPQTSNFPGFAASSSAPCSSSSTLHNPPQPHKQRLTPRASHQARGLFETVSPAASPSVNTSTLSPHPLHTPVLTNRLVQLVSASNKLPKKRPRSEAHHPRMRRFPGPAGLLPQQPQGQNLDEIVVSVPQTPAHGAVARLPSQGPSSQTEEEEFSGGAWAAMKAEMGLDERNPSCFLHSYSVVMVLRRAALKQLPRNKVPNMAVLLKSIVHTNADAKAVFKDPTGEIQGTVHRRLVEERAEELKVGAVLLLKQVGVFSPSHRNHYLNVTPNNLLRLYAPDGARPSSTQLPPLVLEAMTSSPAPTREPGVLRGPVSVMQLEFDEEDDEGKEEPAEVPRERTHAEENESVRSSRAPPTSAENPAPQDPDWDADNLDELLGELPEDSYSL